MKNLSTKYNIKENEEDFFKILSDKKMLGESSILNYNEEFLFLKLENDIEVIKTIDLENNNNFFSDHFFTTTRSINIQDRNIINFLNDTNLSFDNKKDKILDYFKKNLTSYNKFNCEIFYSEDIDTILELEKKGFIKRINNINFEKIYAKKIKKAGQHSTFNYYYDNVSFLIF